LLYYFYHVQMSRLFRSVPHRWELFQSCLREQRIRPEGFPWNNVMRQKFEIYVSNLIFAHWYLGSVNSWLTQQKRSKEKIDLGIDYFFRKKNLKTSCVIVKFFKKLLQNGLQALWPREKANSSRASARRFHQCQWPRRWGVHHCQFEHQHTQQTKRVLVSIDKWNFAA